jgi:hypothetical protein
VEYVYIGHKYYTLSIYLQQKHSDLDRKICLGMFKMIPLIRGKTTPLYAYNLIFYPSFGL